MYSRTTWSASLIEPPLFAEFPERLGPHSGLERRLEVGLDGRATVVGRAGHRGVDAPPGGILLELAEGEVDVGGVHPVEPVLHGLLHHGGVGHDFLLRTCPA